jgi:hypothetical protein
LDIVKKPSEEDTMAKLKEVVDEAPVRHHKKPFVVDNIVHK